MTKKLQWLAVLQRVASFFSHFFRWWVDGLIGTIPLRLRDRAEEHRRRFVLDLSTSPPRWLEEAGSWNYPTYQSDISTSMDSIFLPSSHHSENDSSGSVNDHRWPSNLEHVWVRLGADHILCTTFWLPEAARTHLNEVIQFEIPRQTPFKPSEVYFDVETLDFDRTSDRVAVRLSLVPLDPLKIFLEGLMRHPLRKITLRGAGSQASIRAEISNPNVSPERKLEKTSLSDLSLIVSAALLMGVVIATPFYQRALALDSSHAVLRDLRAQLNTINLTRKILDDKMKRELWIENQIAQASRPKMILRELARLFDGKVQLRQMELSGNALVLRGSTVNPAKLTGHLGGSPLFKDVSFQSTSQLSNDTASEFDIRLRVTP